MVKFNREFLQKVAKKLNEMDDCVSDHELQYGGNLSNFEVDGKLYDLKFDSTGPDGDGSGIWIYCKTFQNEPTDMTVGITGTYSSWDSPDWDRWEVVEPKANVEYVW